MLKVAAKEFLGTGEHRAFEACSTCHDYSGDGVNEFDVDDYIAQLRPRPHLKTLEPKANPKGGSWKDRGFQSCLTESQQQKIKSNKEAALKIKAMKAAARRSEGADTAAIALGELEAQPFKKARADGLGSQANAGFETEAENGGSKGQPPTS